MHWNISIGPDKWPIFSRFLTLFLLKHPARREKNTSNMADILELKLKPYDILSKLSESCVDARMTRN
jgi:hypothetical protein